MPLRRALAALLAATSLAACGTREEPPADPAAGRAPTQRQRDSVIAASRLPGAHGVGSALRAADSATARAALAESVGREP